MKILFLTDNFPPEVNACATRTYEHCKEWVKKDVEVTVLTCAPNFPQGKVYEGYKNKLFQTEYIEGIKVIRVWTYISANKGFIKRIIDYTSFMISSFFVGLFIKTDVIVATSPQFFTAVSGRWLSFWKRKKWVMEVRDIWPESIKAVGAMEDSWIIRFFEYLELKMYKSAWKIVVVTDSFKAKFVKEYGLEKSKIEVIKNGANLALFKPMVKSESLLEKLNLKGKFVIGYIGTHGMAHNLGFILDCAKDVDRKVHFLFIGDGAEKKALVTKKKELNLQNVTMLSPVDKKGVKEYTSILDVGLVNLKKSPTFMSVIPSKIFELAAMHKPILLGVQGESKQIIEDYNIGIAFEPENKLEFIEGIEKMKKSKNSDWNFDKLLKDFNREDLADRMRKLLESK
jgi:glycosyltransferase involved in cell wall biosynthesis